MLSLVFYKETLGTEKEAVNQRDTCTYIAFSAFRACQKKNQRACI